jgi:RHS repeat-associated protein
MRTKAITAKDYDQNPQMNYAYTYDKMDNIKTRNTQAGNYAYNYDALYRLNSVQKDTAQTEAYTYDQDGNRLTSATATDWTYNANNELLSYNGTTNQYDANGNTIQSTVNGQIRNYVYNADNRLIEVKDASNNTIVKYTYDPFGRRVKKQMGSASPANAGGVEVYYLYSDEGLIGEYDSAGTEIKTYGYKANSTWSTDPIFMKQGTNYYFYHNDHLGTPQKMTNLSGAIVWQASYDAFGKATVDAASSITNNLRFPGQYFDAETGLHSNRARYYDPKVGRFVTKDPIGFEGDDVNFYAYVDSVGKPWAVQTNLYQYADNNPINKIDPTGLSACSTTCHLTALAAATPICHWMLYSGPEGPAFFIICEVLYHTLFYDQCMEKCEKPSPCKK